MSEKKQSTRVTAEVKVVAIRRHLIEKTPVSTIADELNVHPNTFYKWQTQLFENGEAVFAKEKLPTKAELRNTADAKENQLLNRKFSLHK